MSEPVQRCVEDHLCDIQELSDACNNATDARQCTIAEDRRKLNNLLPIAKVPIDILIAIFQLCQGPNHILHPYSWIYVTHICHAWRLVGIQAAVLWQCIHSAWPGWEEEVLSRSRQAPLTVVTYSSDSLLSRTFTDHFTRIRSLTVACGDSHLQEEWLSLFPACLPSLSYVTFDTGLHPLPVVQLPAFVSNLPTCMKKIRISGRWTSLHWNDIFLRSLEELCLNFVDDTHGCDTHTVLEALEGMPLLKVLELCGLHDKTMPSPSRIRLPESMRRLLVRNNHLMCARTLSGLIIHPKVALHVDALEAVEAEDFGGLASAAIEGFLADHSPAVIHFRFDMREGERLSDKLSCLGFTSIDPERHCRSTRVSLKFDLSSCSLSDLACVAAILSPFALHAIQVLELGWLGYEPFDEDLREVTEKMSSLTCLQVDVEGISILPTLLENEWGEQDEDEDAMACSLPSLRELAIRGGATRSYPTEDELVALRDAFESRQPHPIRLVLMNCKWPASQYMGMINAVASMYPLEDQQDSLWIHFDDGTTAINYANFVWDDKWTQTVQTSKGESFDFRIHDAEEDGGL